MDGWVDGWMDGWMERWIEGWEDGRMDGWIRAVRNQYHFCRLCQYRAQPIIKTANTDYEDGYFIQSFNYSKIYIASLQGNYSEALPTPVRRKRQIFAKFVQSNCSFLKHRATIAMQAYGLHTRDFKPALAMIQMFIFVLLGKTSVDKPLLEYMTKKLNTR